jgi:hypothetical protein
MGRDLVGAITGPIASWLAFRSALTLWELIPGQTPADYILAWKLLGVSFVLSLVGIGLQIRDLKSRKPVTGYWQLVRFVIVVTNGVPLPYCALTAIGYGTLALVGH